jgi:hypothetical protein
LPQSELARTIDGEVQTVVADLLHQFLACAQLARGKNVEAKAPVTLLRKHLGSLQCTERHRVVDRVLVTETPWFGLLRAQGG